MGKPTKKAESTAISKELAERYQLVLAEEEKALIKNTIAKGSTESQFKFFLYDAQARGLNPLKNEIHFVLRNTYNSHTKAYEQVASHQVGIDGFRKIAQSTGEYEGQTAPVYSEEQVVVADVTAPEWIEVGVWRKGFREPVIGCVYFKEYVQTFKKNGVEKVGSMWAKMPIHMLEKCAEAKALRKAFPDDLSGLYTTEEMYSEQSDAPVAEPVEVQVVQKDKQPEVEKQPEIIDGKEVEDVEYEETTKAPAKAFEDVPAQPMF